MTDAFTTGSGNLSLAELFETACAMEVILKAIDSTRVVVNHNTNLGIILLLSPFAMVPRST